MAKSWRFTDTRISDQDTTSIDNKIKVRLFTKFHSGYLHLYEDHKYTFIGENLSEMHSWSFNKQDSTLVIDSFLEESDLKLKVAEYDDEWLKTHIMGLGKVPIKDTKNPLLFASSDFLELGNVDLLAYSLNKWRIRPAHKENRDEIMKRVQEHMDFLIAYYQMIIDDHRNSFAPMYLQTVFRFYQNGMGVVHEEDMSKGWENCFYDHADAASARKILAEAMHAPGRYPETETYTEGYLVYLKKMKVYLKKIQ